MELCDLGLTYENFTDRSVDRMRNKTLINIGNPTTNSDQGRNYGFLNSADVCFFLQLFFFTAL